MFMNKIDKIQSAVTTYKAVSMLQRDGTLTSTKYYLHATYSDKEATWMTYFLKGSLLLWTTIIISRCGYCLRQQ